MIYSFLFGHLVKIGGGVVVPIPVNYSLQQGMDFWDNLSSQISPDEATLSILFLTAISAELFISDLEFMTYLE
jgi:hypothetical protein